MGYTHYWYRPERLDPDTFQKAVKDVLAVVKKLKESGLELAGASGEARPFIGDSVIAFNGRRDCGHRERTLGIAWPSDKAGGMKVEGGKVTGIWNGGALVEARMCDGDCSHESFMWEVNEVMPDYQRKEGNKLLFNFCKTAYKPYDLAVTAALIILKHHFGDSIKVTSDGEAKDWRDGGMFCQMVLGYGAMFKPEVSQEL